MKVEEGFWYVFNTSGDKPSVRHPTFTEARTEAIRLSKQNPGKEIFVLKPSLSFKTEIIDPPLVEKIYA